jgi:hypothetical protein
MLWNDGLTQEQIIAASSIGSHARLLAGPGTGKTLVLSWHDNLSLRNQAWVPHSSNPCAGAQICLGVITGKSLPSNQNKPKHYLTRPKKMDCQWWHCKPPAWWIGGGVLFCVRLSINAPWQPGVHQVCTNLTTNTAVVFAFLCFIQVGTVTVEQLFLADRFGVQLFFFLPN